MVAAGRPGVNRGGGNRIARPMTRPHPYRSLGLLPPLLTALAVACFWLTPAAGFIGLAVAALVWWLFRRPVVELLFKLLSLPFYRVRAVGPGARAVPARGPCLVIANHSAYLDPLFLANFVPRPVAPMMTSLFYDKPGIRHLMRFVFTDTIRVPEAAMKRDTTEIAAAVAALDAGKCVVLFPEGYLRRREDQPLRRFGRGVWEILRARPETPVVACWIEGNWGDFFSYKGGPPTRNKRLALLRRISIGVLPPERVPADLLADHHATRFHLMNVVASARQPLGLPALPVVEGPTRDDPEIP
jgi:1-acyl-sn-glycerol-3-phosphate acyltransferase